MAGGNASDLRAPYPKGEDGWVLIQSHAFNIIASQTDEVVDAITVPFAFQAKYCEINATVLTEGTGITMNIEDDSASAKAIVTDQGVAAIVVGVSGVPQELTIANKATTINAGAIVEFSYTSGSSDTSIDAVIRLWVKPVN